MDCYIARRTTGRIAFDYFNRANGALGTSDGGQAWVTPTETLSIVSNKAARGTSTPGHYGASAFIDIGAQSHTIEGDVTWNDGDGIGFRVLNPSTAPDQNGWVAYFYGGNVLISLISSGVASLKAYHSFTWASGTTKHMKVVASQAGADASIACYIDGVSVVTLNYATAPTGTLTYAGLHILNTGAAPTSTFDNVLITRLA